MLVKGYDSVIDSTIRLSFINPFFSKFNVLIDLILSQQFIIKITINQIAFIPIKISILNSLFIFNPIMF